MYFETILSIGRNLDTQNNIIWGFSGIFVFSMFLHSMFPSTQRTLYDRLEVILSYVPSFACLRTYNRLYVRFRSGGRLGVNVTNILRGPFTYVDPKRAKKTVKSSVFFCAFGICAHKSFSKNVGKINPWLSMLPKFYKQLFEQKIFEQLFFNYSLAM